MERNPTLTFLSGTPPAEVPITDLTINDIRLVCVEGDYNGYVIYPDNVETPQFANLGNGQYGIGYFGHAYFKAAIGSGYNYYVKVQRKISGTWTDQWQFGVFRIGDEKENLDLKPNDSVVVHNTGNESIAGVKAFSDLITFAVGIVTTKIKSLTGIDVIEILGNRMWLGDYTGGTPLLKGTPIYANSAVYRSWVQSAITEAVQNILEGNYVESPNIIRVMPDGPTTAGQIYGSWLTALVYGNGFVNSTKHLTALICGFGNSASSIPMTAYEVSGGVYAYVVDYMHWRGLGNNIKVTSDGNFASEGTKFEAGAIGRIVMEDIYFYFDNDGQTGEIKNIIFKNCKFESRGGTIDFTGCQFEGKNYFTATGDNQFTFTNCKGNSIYSDNPINVTGTFLIPYETPAKKVTPKISLKEIVLSEPITPESGIEPFTIFRDATNDNKLSIIDDNNNIFTFCLEPISKLTFLEPVEAANIVEPYTVFVDKTNDNKLSYYDNSGGLFTLDVTEV